MSEAENCPLCGSPSPGEIEAKAFNSPPSPDGSAREVESEPQPKAGPDFLSIPLLAPGSNDDDFVSRAYGRKLMGSEPDPILGEFITPTSADLPDDPGPKFKDAPRLEPVQEFPSLNFDAPPGSKPGPGPASDEAFGGHEEDGEVEVHRSPWSLILLASYASAITLAFIWLLIKDRSRDVEKAEPKSSTVVKQSQGPRQAELSGDVIPPEPLLGEHHAELGKMITIGMLEITPIDVKRQAVKLQRSNLFAGTEPTRDGGKNALVLRLKLKNLSTDKVFAPLDKAYLRERGKQVVDTFVKTDDGDRVYPFPLVVDSELSIVGQDFTELRPGESRSVVIVTAPDAPPDSAGPFTWRVRLRTGINRNDAIVLRWPDKPTEAATPPKPR